MNNVFRLARLALVLMVAVCGAAAAAEPLLIGAEDDWAPFSSGRDGKAVGMAVELVEAIFAEASLPVRLVSMPYARCMNETQAGRIAGCFNTTPDEQLRRDYLFHARPLFSDPTLIVARAGTTAKALRVADLAGKHVAVTNGYTYGDAFEADKSIRRETVLRDINALRMVAAGRVEYAIVYRRILGHLLRGEGKDLASQLTVVGEVQMNELYLSFSRRHPEAHELLRRFDAAHARLVANGRLVAIGKRWE